MAEVASGDEFAVLLTDVYGDSDVAVVADRIGPVEQRRRADGPFAGEIEIGAVVVWQVDDTAQASFDVENYFEYVDVQIEAAVRFGETIWIEDLVEHLEAAASAPVYAALKRPDEKYVTEEAFDNPKFVEDIVRDLALRLEDDSRVTWYSINSENFESIHNHNAYAQITRDKR